MAVKNNIFFKTHSELEDYFTHPVIAKFCASRIEEPGPFIEPAAGNGSFLNYLPKDTIAYDVCPQDERIIKTDDSLGEDWGDRIMVTNPPYKLTKKFIAKALEHSEFCYLIMQPALFAAPKDFYLEKLWLFRKGKHRASKLSFFVNSTGQVKEMFACFAKIRRLNPGEKSNLPLPGYSYDSDGNLIRGRRVPYDKSRHFWTDPFKFCEVPSFAEEVYYRYSKRSGELVIL